MGIPGRGMSSDLCANIWLSVTKLFALDVRYLDAVLDGDAGERVHPSNLVLQEVAVGERR